MTADDPRNRLRAQALRSFVGTLMDGARKKAFFFDVDRALCDPATSSANDPSPSELVALLRDLAAVNDGGVALCVPPSATATGEPSGLPTRIAREVADVSLVVGTESATLSALMRTPRYVDRVPFFFGGGAMSDDFVGGIHRLGGKVARVAQATAAGADVCLSGAADVHWLIRDFIAQNGDRPAQAGPVEADG